MLSKQVLFVKGHCGAFLAYTLPPTSCFLSCLILPFKRPLTQSSKITVRHNDISFPFPLCSPFISVSILLSLSAAEFGWLRLFLAALGLPAPSPSFIFTRSCFPAAPCRLFPSTLSIFTRQSVCSRPIASKSSPEH